MRRAQLVLPNLASLPQRGDLTARWALAKQLGMEVVEMPADLIKSRREEERTGRAIGSFLDRDAVELLYAQGSSPEARYVLHTDPGIPRRDGAMVVPELRWRDRRWTDRYADALRLISLRLGGKPQVVELHSGKGNDIAEVVAAMGRVSAALEEQWGESVTVAVENKPGQAVASAEDLARAGELMDRMGADGLGIMLDVPNLWKVGRHRAEKDIGAVPPHRLVGLHVHERHRAPAPESSIDWKAVRRLLLRSQGTVLINPEVFHRGELVKALRFVQERLFSEEGVQNPHKGGAA